MRLRKILSAIISMSLAASSFMTMAVHADGEPTVSVSVHKYIAEAGNVVYDAFGKALPTKSNSAGIYLEDDALEDAYVAWISIKNLPEINNPEFDLGQVFTNLNAYYDVDGDVTRAVTFTKNILHKPTIDITNNILQIKTDPTVTGWFYPTVELDPAVTAVDNYCAIFFVVPEGEYVEFTAKKKADFGSIIGWSQIGLTEFDCQSQTENYTDYYMATAADGVTSQTNKGQLIVESFSLGEKAPTPTPTPTPVPTTIEIAPATPAAIEIDGTVQLTATVKDQFEAVMNGQTVEWSSNSAAATVVDGLVTGKAAGEAVITAKCGDATASVTITVKEAAPLTFTFEPADPEEVTTADGKKGIVWYGNKMLRVDTKGKKYTAEFEAEGETVTKKVELDLTAVESEGLIDLTFDAVMTFKDNILKRITRFNVIEN